MKILLRRSVPGERVQLSSIIDILIQKAKSLDKILAAKKNLLHLAQLSARGYFN